MKTAKIGLLLIVFMVLIAGIGCVPEYTLTTSSSTGGSVTSPGQPGPFSYAPDTVVNIVATPDIGYSFVNWTGDITTIANANSASTTITMNSDYSIKANFAPIQYTLTTASSTGGSVTAPGQPGPFSYAPGTEINISATPDIGYFFVNWTGDTSTIANANFSSTIITMNDDYSIKANFAPIQYTLTSSVTGNGSISPSAGIFTCGTVVTLTATPDSNWTFNSWSGDLSGTANPVNITMNSNKIVVATFTQNSETVTTPTTPSGPSSGYLGETLTFSTGGASSNLGHSVQYQFDWGDGNTSGWLPIGTTNATYSWKSEGVFNITAQARCAADIDIVSNQSPIQSITIISPPSWKILVLIYQDTDFSFTDSNSIQRRVVASMTQEEINRATNAATRFFLEDVPQLNSGYMIPTVTVHHPQRALTQLDSDPSNGYWPSGANTAPERDPAFDSIVVIWKGSGIDINNGNEPYNLNSYCGLTSDEKMGQTYSTMVISCVKSNERNIFKHEWGHAILDYYDAAGTALKPAVNNHINDDDNQYVNCQTGQYYILTDETDDNPIPNSIYNNLQGFTHDYYSGTTALPDTTTCLGINRSAWASGGPVSKIYYYLTTSSSDGGSVKVPGQPGPYAYQKGISATISAAPTAIGYNFANWTGTGVTAGKVANPNSASTTIIMDANYSVQANFVLDSSPFCYRQQFTIAGSPDGNVSEYQMKLTVHKGVGASIDDNFYLNNHCNNDFSDIRFTEADGVTLLDYWIESYTSSSHATVWIKIPSIPASPSSTSFFIYYGNPSAISNSNGANTFIIFNDTGSLIGWTAMPSAWFYTAPTWSTSNGKIRATTDAIPGDWGYGGILYCNTPLGVDSYRLHADIQASNGLVATNEQQGLITKTSQEMADNGHARWLDGFNRWQIMDEAGTSSWSSDDNSFNAGSIHEYVLTRNSVTGELKLYVDNSLKVTHIKTDWNPQHIGLHLYNELSNRWIEYDNIFVGKFTTNEPSFSAWGSETILCTP